MRHVPGHHLRGMGGRSSSPTTTLSSMARPARRTQAIRVRRSPTMRASASTISASRQVHHLCPQPTNCSRDHKAFPGPPIVPSPRIVPCGTYRSFVRPTDRSPGRGRHSAQRTEEQHACDHDHRRMDRAQRLVDMSQPRRPWGVLRSRQGFTGGQGAQPHDTFSDPRDVLPPTTRSWRRSGRNELLACLPAQRGQFVERLLRRRIERREHGQRLEAGIPLGAAGSTGSRRDWPSVASVPPTTASDASMLSAAREVWELAGRTRGTWILGDHLVDERTAAERP